VCERECVFVCLCLNVCGGGMVWVGGCGSIVRVDGCVCGYEYKCGCVGVCGCMRECGVTVCQRVIPVLYLRGGGLQSLYIMQQITINRVPFPRSRLQYIV